MRLIGLKLVDCLICEQPMYILNKVVIMCVGGNRGESLVLERGVVGSIYLLDFKRLIGVRVGTAILSGFGVGFLRRLISVKK